MGRMLGADTGEEPRELFGAPAIFVGGRLYRNTAAKFWTSLIDEIAAEHADCVTARLSAPRDGLLGRKHLFPERALLEGMDTLAEVDLQDAFRDAIAEMELLGPPAPVAFRLTTKAGAPMEGVMPVECIDAELFVFVAVWLLEWAGIPESQWNGDVSRGAVDADAVGSDRHYRLAFSVAREPLKEGLYLLTVEFSFTRTSPSGSAKTTDP